MELLEDKRFNGYEEIKSIKNELNEKLLTSYQNIFKNYLRIENNKHLISKYNKIYQVLLHGDSKKTNEIINDEELYKYFKKLYHNYDEEVTKLVSWKNLHKKNNGFTMTTGILSFNPKEYKRKQPISIINEVGDILKTSKANKGNIYIENKVS